MLREYLRSRFKIIILLISLIVIFASSYFLFDMPLITIVYPACLCLLVIIIVGFVDYHITVSKHEKIKRDEFAETKNLIERDYIEVIEKLKEEEKIHAQKTNSDYNNMI